MAIEHLSASATSEEAAKVLERDGCCVIDELASPERMDRVQEEMAPYLEAVQSGIDAFSGLSTRRCGALIARAPSSHALLLDDTVLGAVRGVLSHATSVRLHLTQLIAIGADETPQPIHRDQWAFDFFPFPKGYEVQCNTLWAMTDFSEENGATRVIPGSHRYDDKLEFEIENTEPAEMRRGSVLLYTGSLYHGGGANRTDDVRIGVNLTYAVSWLRQEENQYLSTPLERARELPRDLQRLMGYARGAYALGYIDDLRDPIEVLVPGAGSTEFGDLEAAAAAQKRSREVPSG